MNQRAAAIVAAAAAVAGHGVQAAEWSFAPSIATSVVSETNPRFVEDSGGDLQSLAAGLTFDVERQTETMSLALNSSAARRQYDADDSLNRSDLGMAVKLQHAATERLSWSATASVARDTTLTSELGTSGVTRVGFRHQSVGAQLQPEWRLSERWNTAASLQLQRDSYPSAGSGLTDYQYLAGTLTATWQRSPQDSFGLVVRTGALQVAHASADIKDASALLQYTRLVNERWQLRLAAGPAWAHGPGSKQDGENFNFELGRVAEYGAVFVSLDRATAPTGRGYLTRRDSMSLQLRRELAPHISGSLTARYLRSRNVVGALGFAFDDVRYRRVEAGVSWSFAPQWSTEIRAGYADQNLRASGVEASGADLGLGIRWSRTEHVL